ncbi:mucosal addressin cell adhesion molecule 1 [Thamnophis elegans]|uniref:mucosal addressin cell adhesion molecule 1 n=1 Tax=Thamnophis elegans TaxID=35005 RepID=UPI00137764DC|nr:mucosal addressin cell adhesion molecule 1 [Thamnophis elegans]
MAVISLVFLFSLVSYGCSAPTAKPIIHPLKPLVERGGTIQLTCSMQCPDAEVQWEGLDTDLGNIISNHTQSILTLSNATVNTEGTKMCSGRCQGKSQAEMAMVKLNVYSFPDTLQLDSQPKMLTVGQPAHLLCSMSHIYPHSALTLSWFQGEEQLEASKETEEEEMEDSEDQMFVYHSELELPRVAEDVTYKCKATLEVEGEIFAKERTAIAITSTTTTQEILGATATDALTPTSTATDALTPTSTATNALTPTSTATDALTLTSGRTSQTSALELLTMADWKSSGVTTTSLLRLVSTKHTSSGTSVVTPTAAPTLESLTEDHNSITVVNNSTETSYPTDQELTAKPLSTTEGPTTKPVSPTGDFSTEGTTGKPKDHCRPTIVPVPTQGTLGGTLRITCQAAKCSRDVRIQWVETPVAQSRYRLEEAEGRSTLMVEDLSLEHQGVYRCVAIANQPRIATLHVVVSADVVNTDALFTIGVTGSLFGLILTGYITHRWRQRQRW